jgi:hypothetical protein
MRGPVRASVEVFWIEYPGFAVSDFKDLCPLVRYYEIGMVRSAAPDVPVMGSGVCCGNERRRQAYRQGKDQRASHDHSNRMAAAKLWRLRASERRLLDGGCDTLARASSGQARHAPPSMAALPSHMTSSLRQHAHLTGRGGRGLRPVRHALEAKRVAGRDRGRFRAQ